MFRDVASSSSTMVITIIIAFLIFTITEEKTTETTTKTKTRKNNDKNLCNHIHLTAVTKPKPVEFKSTSCFEIVNIQNTNTTLKTRHLCD